MAKSLLSNELDDRKEELISKLAELITNETTPRVCGKLGTCNYLREQIGAVNMRIPEAYQYLTLVCELYPDACKLNR